MPDPGRHGKSSETYHSVEPAAIGRELGIGSELALDHDYVQENARTPQQSVLQQSRPGEETARRRRKTFRPRFLSSSIRQSPMTEEDLHREFFSEQAALMGTDRLNSGPGARLRAALPDAWAAALDVVGGAASSGSSRSPGGETAGANSAAKHYHKHHHYHASESTSSGMAVPQAEDCPAANESTTTADDIRARRRAALKGLPKLIVETLCGPCISTGKCCKRNAVFSVKIIFPLLGHFLEQQGRSWKESLRWRNLVPGVSCLICVGQVAGDLGGDIASWWHRRVSPPTPVEAEPTNPRLADADAECSSSDCSLCASSLSSCSMSSECGSAGDPATIEDVYKRPSDCWPDPGSPQEARNIIHDKERYPTKEIVKSSFVVDIAVGMSIGAMCLPQGMSYALLAGLPAQFGLYNNLWYPFLYFFLGTSRHAVAGVSAVENLMIGESIDAILSTPTMPGEDAPDLARENCGSALALMCAIFYVAFRICKLSVLADLLADPVLSGFSSGAAFIVGTSQLKHVLGMSGIKSDWGLPKTWVYVMQHLQDIQLAAVTVSIVCLAILITVKKFSAKYCRRFPLPGPLIVVILSIVVSYYADLNAKYNITIVGPIPGGLPRPEVPEMNWFNKSRGSMAALGDTEPPSAYLVAAQALKLALVFFIIHVSISKSIAMQKGYRIDPAQELIAFAGCNLVGSFFQCYPNCTSVSRTSVAATLNAVTGLHLLCCTAFVLVVVVWVTGPLAFLPMATLGSIVIHGVGKMAEFGELKRLWRLQKVIWMSSNTIGGGASSPDLLLWLVSFLCTCLFGASQGIILSVCLSLLWLLMRIVRPKCAMLGRLPSTRVYRSIARFPLARLQTGVIVYRVDAPLNFCNSGYIELKLMSVVKNECRVPPGGSSPLGSPAGAGSGSLPVLAMEASSPSCAEPKDEKKRNIVYDVTEKKYLILDCSSVNDLDVTAIGAFRRVAEAAKNFNITLLFANWKGPQRDFLQQADFYSIISPSHCFLNLDDAVCWAREQMLREHAQAMRRSRKLKSGTRVAGTRVPGSMVGNMPGSMVGTMLDGMAGVESPVVSTSGGSVSTTNPAAAEPPSGAPQSWTALEIEGRSEGQPSRE